jgi:nucleotide-binding universal stress UspA family protein
VVDSPNGAARVLVYVDGSDASIRAVDRAIELGAEGAELTALVVIPPRLDRAAVSQFEIEEEDLDARFAREVLERVAGRVERTGQRVAGLVAEGPVVDVIVEHGRSGQFDVVLVGRKPGPRFVTDLADTLRRKPGVPLDIVD